MKEKLKKLKKSNILKWLLLSVAVVALLFLLFRSYIYLFGNGNNTDKTSDNYTEGNSEEELEGNDEVSDTEAEQTEESAADYYNNALELSKQKKYQEAIIAINKAIILDEINDIYWSKKASFYALLKENDNEKSTLEEGLKKIPDSEILKAKLDLLNQDIGTNMEGVRE